MQLDINPTYGRESSSMPPKTEVSGQVNQVTPMGLLLPSLQSLTGLTSVVVQALLGSNFSPVCTFEDSCLRRASVQYRQFPLVKDLGIRWEYQPSSPSLQGVFSLQVSYLSSNFTIHRVEFFSCSSQSPLLAFSGPSSRKPLESQRHPSQFGRRYAMSYSGHQSEAHGTLHRPTALGASEAMKDSRPSASDVTGSPLQSLPGLRTAVSLSRRATKQVVYPVFSIDRRYVMFDIESNSVRRNSVAPTADNNRKEDARLLYIMELASCSCPRSGCSAIIYGGQEHDFFAGHVSRNRRKRIYEQLIPKQLARARLQMYPMILSKYPKGLN